MTDNADLVAENERLRAEVTRLKIIVAALNGLVDIYKDKGSPESWCDYCTPRKLYHPTDHPEHNDGDEA